MAADASKSPVRRGLSWALPFLLFGLSVSISQAVLSMRGLESGGRAVPPGGDRLLPELARRPSLAFGFRNFAADVAWLQAVQVSGVRRLSDAGAERLDVLINAVIRLDDRFKVPYFLGGLLLGESPRHAERAIALLRAGRAKFPDDWRLPYYEGYTWYFILGRPREGGLAFRAAAELPDSPPYVSLLAARMLTEGNDPETALGFLERMLRDETDPARLAVLERRAREVVVERDAQMLERAARLYRERTGTYPARLGELVEAGILRKLPEEPNGGRYTISGNGAVSSTRAARLRVFKAR